MLALAKERERREREPCRPPPYPPASLAIIVSLGNSFFSFVAGFAVFSSLGYMAHEAGMTEIPNVGGPGLLFVT